MTNCNDFAEVFSHDIVGMYSMFLRLYTYTRIL